MVSACAGMIGVFFDMYRDMLVKIYDVKMNELGYNSKKCAHTEQVSLFFYSINFLTGLFTDFEDAELNLTCHRLSKLC